MIDEKKRLLVSMRLQVGLMMNTQEKFKKLSMKVSIGS